jgi:formylmethanofuran dehydrogenase subunit C
MRGTFSVGLASSGGSKQVSASQLGPFDNNSTVRLEAVRYRGNVEIRANKVVFKGRGTGATEIAGDVRISGNSCTLTGLTVSGDVYLSGNNNSLRGVNVKGNVISEGNNNSW